MENSTQLTVSGCLKYWWENFSTAIHFKKKIASILAVAAIIVGLLLATLQSSGKLPAGWSNSQLALWAEVGAAIAGFVYFLFWRPYDRDQQARTEIRSLNEKLFANESAELEAKRAKLEVECDTAIKGCCVTSEGSFRHYFRAKIKLHCHQAVSGCFASLLQIHRASDGQVIREHEVDKLPFAPSSDADTLLKTLSPDVPVFLDVLVVDIRIGVNRILIAAANHGVKPAMTVDNRYGFQSFEKYYLTLKIGGTGIPTQAVRLLFDWTGDYRTASMVRV